MYNNAKDLVDALGRLSGSRKVGDFRVRWRIAIDPQIAAAQVSSTIEITEGDAEEPCSLTAAPPEVIEAYADIKRGIERWRTGAVSWLPDRDEDIIQAEETPPAPAPSPAPGLETEF